MKNLFKEFTSSIYNREAYRNIGQKPLRDIIIYMIKISIITSVVAILETAIILAVLQATGQLLGVNVDAMTIAATWTIGLSSVFIIVFLTSMITWSILGFIFGILILIVMKITKRDYNYSQSVKAGLYAFSAAAVLTGSFEIFKIAILSDLSLLLVVIILIINLRIPKITPATV